MSRRFVYIINPISGTGNKGLLQEKVESFAAGQSFPYHVFPSSPSGEYGEVAQFIRETRVTDVVVAGGDGTINGAIGYLYGTGVSFGIIPAGSGNGLALSAGISRNPDLALQNLLTGKALWVDAFTVNDRFACMMCGLGFDAQVAHDFANDPRRGIITYIRKVVRHFFRAHAYSFALHFGNMHLDLDAWFISVANSNQYGNNFTIAPKANLSDGLLDVVIATKRSKLQLLMRTLGHVAGLNSLQEVSKLNKDLGIVYFQTDTLRIVNGEGAPLHVDGDPAPACENLDIKVLKHCYMLIQP